MPQFKLFNFIFNFSPHNGKQKWTTKGWKTIKRVISFMENKEMENKDGKQTSILIYK